MSSSRRRTDPAQTAAPTSPADGSGEQFGPGRLGMLAQALIDLGQGHKADAQAGIEMFSVQDCGAANHVFYELAVLLEQRFVAAYREEHGLGTDAADDDDAAG